MQREWQGYQDKQDVRNYSYPDHPVIPANCLFYSFFILPGCILFMQLTWFLSSYINVRLSVCLAVDRLMYVN
jgi:hypothetical protein